MSVRMHHVRYRNVTDRPGGRSLHRRPTYAKITNCGGYRNICGRLKKPPLRIRRSCRGGLPGLPAPPMTIAAGWVVPQRKPQGSRREYIPALRSGVELFSARMGGGGGSSRGRICTKRPLSRLLWVLSCRNKKVPRPNRPMHGCRTTMDKRTVREAGLYGIIHEIPPPEISGGDATILRLLSPPSGLPAHRPRSESGGRHRHYSGYRWSGPRRRCRSPAPRCRKR